MSKSQQNYGLPTCIYRCLFYLEREGFSGMARWMQKQSAEETGHAYAIAEYMIKREATPKVDKVDVFHKVGVTLLKYSSMLWSMKNMFPN